MKTVATSTLIWPMPSLYRGSCQTSTKEARMDFEQLRRAFEKAAANAPHEPYSDWALEIAAGTLRVLTKRFGADFAREVRAEIEAKADRMAGSSDPDKRADAEEVRALIKEPIWEELGVTDT